MNRDITIPLHLPPLSTKEVLELLNASESEIRKRPTYHGSAILALRGSLDEYFDTALLDNARVAKTNKRKRWARFCEQLSVRNLSNAPRAIDEVNQFLHLARPTLSASRRHVVWQSHWHNWPTGAPRMPLPEFREKTRCILASIVLADPRSNPPAELARVAKCRYRLCRKPYFLSRRKLSYQFKNGAFCSSLHSNLAKRDGIAKEQIEIAVEEALKISFDNTRAKRRRLVTVVNRHFRDDLGKKISVRWKHWGEFQEQLENQPKETER